MLIQETKIANARILIHDVHEDERGFFNEWFKPKDIYQLTGVHFETAQANFSTSSGNVIRGIHFSLANSGQQKLVTCVNGRILDVIVDLRINSSTFMKHEIIELNAGDGKSVMIGTGLGHGFQVLSEKASVCYLLTSEYDPVVEHTINPFDRELNVGWNKFAYSEFILSKRDLQAESLKYFREANLLPKIN